MPAIYGKRKNRNAVANTGQATSPAHRKEPWSTVTIRSRQYAMLRELAGYYGISIGQVAMELIEKEFFACLAEQNQRTGVHDVSNL